MTASTTNTLTSENTTPVDIRYLPPITAPPTEMKVIYAIIKRSLDIMEELQIPFIFLKVDQAIYSKVLDAMFKMEQERLGVFG